MKFTTACFQPLSLISFVTVVTQSSFIIVGCLSGISSSGFEAKPNDSLASGVFVTRDLFY
jgi:hypothetical protein